MPTKDYYEILGVNRGAKPEEIKTAYRKLALQHHPDRNQGDKAAEEKFRECTHAYQVLIDEQKRSAYDRFGAEGVNASAGFGEGYGGFSDVFSDIFEDFFGMGPKRGQSTASRGTDLGIEIEITFGEAIFGVEKDLHVKRDEPCRGCKGEGAEPGSKRETCKTCRGTGQTTVSSGFFSIARSCQVCGGHGSTISKLCKICRGAGKETVDKKIHVKIPPGVDNGTRLRISGEGETGARGGSRGDLYVDIFTAPHEIFKRHGADILCEIPIGFAQAALGAEIDVPTPYGPEKMKIPAGTQTGRVFRLKEKGAPSLQRQGHKGDLHARIVIETPTALSPKQKELLQEFAEASGDKTNPMTASFLQKVKSFLKASSS